MGDLVTDVRELGPTPNLMTQGGALCQNTAAHKTPHLSLSSYSSPFSGACHLIIQIFTQKIRMCVCHTRWYSIWPQDPPVIHVVHKLHMDITRMNPDSLRTSECSNKGNTRRQYSVPGTWYLVLGTRCWMKPYRHAEAHSRSPPWHAMQVQLKIAIQ